MHLSRFRLNYGLRISAIIQNSSDFNRLLFSRTSKTMPNVIKMNGSLPIHRTIRSVPINSKKINKDKKSVVQKTRVKTKPEDERRAHRTENESELNLRKPLLLSKHKVEVSSEATKEVCDSEHDGRTILKENLNLNVDVVFNMLFTNESNFLSSFHEMRKSTNLCKGEWKANRDGQQTRNVSVTVALQSNVGPKTVKVNECQVMRKCSVRGEIYAIDVVTVNSGVPYADVFNIFTHYCLSRGINNTTDMVILAKINFVKSTWAVIKAFVAKHSFDGLSDYFQCLYCELQKEEVKKKKKK